jgi:hypothetical protein
MDTKPGEVKEGTEQENAKGPTEHTITIEVENVNGKDKIRYRPQRKIKALSGDTIDWICEYPWAVDFGRTTPLEASKLWGQGDLKPSPVPKTVRGDAAIGTYEYFVAVWKDGSILTDDPEVDVDED